MYDSFQTLFLCSKSAWYDIFFTHFFSHLVIVGYVFTYSLKISALRFPSLNVLVLLCLSRNGSPRKKDCVTVQVIAVRRSKEDENKCRWY